MRPTRSKVFRIPENRGDIGVEQLLVIVLIVVLILLIVGRL